MKHPGTPAEFPGPGPTSPASPPPPDLHQAYHLLRERFGHQDWWPGDSPLEVCLGAILVQNTAWTGVERALASLRAITPLQPRPLLDLPRPRLEQAIRPAGCFRVKADRLQAFLRVLVHECDASIDRLFAGPRDQVRQRLLAIRGIGPETADCLLLYAGGHPSFVIDAYAIRVFRRHGWFGLGGPADTLPRAVREDLRRRCMEALALGSAEEEVERWGDFHAQLVAVGKTHCRPRDPRCATCPLQPLLPVPGLLPSPVPPGDPVRFTRGRVGP